jgi:hypothetical protein
MLMRVLFWVLMYFIGMFVSFIITFVYCYWREHEVKGMLPDVRSIYSKLDGNARALAIGSIVVFPISVAFVVLYFLLSVISELPAWIVKQLLAVANTGKNKVLKGRIKLLTVGQFINLVRFTHIKDFEPREIMAIDKDSITLSDKITYSKKCIVLVDDDLYVLARPYD